MIDWAHIGETFLTVTAPLVLYMWKNRSEAKKQMELRHQANQAVLQQLVEHKKYYPHHKHKEDGVEVLTAAGIEYPPKNGA